MPDDTKIVVDASGSGAPPVEVPLTTEERAQRDAARAHGHRQRMTHTFEAQEDQERLRVINERARQDPAYAALADIVLRGKGQ